MEYTPGNNPQDKRMRLVYESPPSLILRVLLLLDVKEYLLHLEPIIAEYCLSLIRLPNRTITRDILKGRNYERSTLDLIFSIITSLEKCTID